MSTAHIVRLTFVISCLIPSAIRAQVPTELREAMGAWDQALTKADVPGWDRLTAEDFMVVVADGSLMTKAQALVHFRAQGAATPQPLIVVDGTPVSGGTPVLENAAVFAEPTLGRLGRLQQEQISQYDHVFVRRGLQPLSNGDARVLEIWIRDARRWRVAAMQFTSVQR